MALIVSLTVVTHLPLLLHHQPIDDERVYAVVADEIVDGGQPYVSAVERKPPLLFWTYAAVFEAFGEYNWDALHAVSIAWVLLTMAGLYVIGRRLFNHKTGLVAALLYCIFQPGIYWNNEAFNGEVLMNLPVVWACAVALAPSRSRFRAELFASGAMLAAGFLLKQPAALAAIPVGHYLFMRNYRTTRGYSFFDSLGQVGMLSAGFVSVLGLVAALLWREGLLREALYWTIGDHDVPYIFWSSAVERSVLFAATCLPLIIGSCLAATEESHWHARPAERAALLLLTLVSAVGVAVTGRFYPHYYIAVIPFLSLLAAPLFADLWTRSLTSASVPFSTLTQGWIAASVIVFGVAAWIGFGRQPVGTETGRYYPLTGRIFGSERPAIDTTSRILPGAWDTLATDLRAHPAAFIADLEVGPDAQYPVERFPVLKRLLETEYQPVARTAEGVIYQRRTALN